ncbi:hypothetical protein GCM10014715_45960 [Streptomyces spiralis]|uniref:Uncharacterized protein n=1 Tax=Streptomyces spiralis TaxID=66376 RepID=A0A919DU52_9ACTN|nr:hypothetical protein GCM10014715_45960 [Streptomyces spiralis]
MSRAVSDAAGRDPVAAAVVVRSLMMLGVIVTVPGLSHFFGSRSLGPAGWTIALTSAAESAVLPTVATDVTRRLGPGNVALRKGRVHLQVM